MLDLSAYEGIIFDMDGTLVDSMGGHMDAWKITCEKFGYPFEREYMYGLGGVPTLQTVHILNDKYNLDRDPETVAKFKKQTWETMDFMPPLIASTMAVFEHYRPTKKIAIGTGADRDPAEQLLTYHGLLARIDGLVTSTDVKSGKPAPDTFLQAADKLGLPAHACVVFEDTDIGREAAQRAGMDCILVKEGEIVIDDV